jgi:hypothetical protein
MEPDEIRDWIRRSPVRIRMNNGDTFDVPSPEFALVGDYSVAVLSRTNGHMLNRLHALINISEVSEIPQQIERKDS